ncbi:transposase domain-containing protein [Ruegeria pomeroyi]|nr:transposase domain-containing protein [Ruegeria pomeroyi]
MDFIAAVAYTLIETARMNGVNPDPWLTWVFERMQDHNSKRIEDMMP